MSLNQVILATVAATAASMHYVEAIPLEIALNIQKIRGARISYGNGDEKMTDFLYDEVKDKSTQELFESNDYVPKYPATYAIEADFGLPYVKLVEPVRVCVDSNKKMQSISYYNGLDRVIYDLKNHKSYEDYARLDKRACKQSALKSGPTSYHHHESVLKADAKAKAKRVNVETVEDDTEGDEVIVSTKQPQADP